MWVIEYQCGCPDGGGGVVEGHLFYTEIEVIKFIEQNKDSLREKYGCDAAYKDEDQSPTGKRGDFTPVDVGDPQTVRI